MMKYLLFTLLVLPILLMGAGCQTLQPVVDACTELGTKAGAIPQSLADSIRISTHAFGGAFQDITSEQEYYIGRAVAATILGLYRPYHHKTATRYLNQIGQTLAQASDRPETFGGYHFLILDSYEINAFAAPGGLIFVSRGMLRCCESEDALAAILAHEIGHVQDQHGLRAIKTDRLTSALTIVAAEGAKQFGPAEVAQLAELFEGAVGDVVSTLTSKGYSRKQERQADAAAVEILGRVGYDPHALIDMLTEMSRQLKPGAPDFAKTHPDPKDRINEIESLVDKLPPVEIPRARQIRFERVIARL